MSDTPAPQLRDYQDQGVDWIVRRFQEDNKAVLLADEAGLGKTLQALQTAVTLTATSILVICPAGARRVWLHEIIKWFPGWSRWVVLLEPGAKLRPDRLSSNDPIFLIVGYDELSNSSSNVASQLQGRSWDLLVIDEAHYLKNPSNRTYAVYGKRGSDEGVQSAADKVLLLTGTPTPNHAGELWQHYRTFWPGVFDRRLSQDQFEERFTRYRDTVYGRQVIGSKNQEALRQALGPVILRRRKDDVLDELPPLQLQDIPLAPVPHWRDRLSFESRAAVARLGWVERGDEHLLAAMRNPDTKVATMRRELGELKVPSTCLWVQERMQSTEKLLVFAWHRSVIEALREGLLEFNPEVVTGNTPPQARALAVETFQQDPQVRVFIGQILAAGTAITLTAASEVAIVEPSWVPGENVQAICRAHRLGQRDSVLASFLYLPNTLDERIMQVFRRKASEIAELQGEK